MIPLAFGVKEDLRLAVGARDAFSMTGVDLQPRECANLDLQHFLSGFLAMKLRSINKKDYKKG